MTPKIIEKPIQNLIVFFIDFLMDFIVVLGAPWGSATLIFELLSMRKRGFYNSAQFFFDSFLDGFWSRKWQQNH